jgi:hypothetical protein
MNKFKQFGSDNWIEIFPVWHEMLGRMFDGLNWMNDERELLEFMREEIVNMVTIIDSRLAELKDRPE